MQVWVKYDGFESRWNDWISASEVYRIAPHASRCCASANKSANQNIGTHVFAATKYGKSDQAKLLRAKIAVYKDKHTNNNNNNNNNNNKLLLFFDFSEVDVLMAGYVHKRGSWNTNWSRRYFRLRNDCCLYYSDDAHNTSMYKGVIPLKSIVRMAMASDPKFDYAFSLETKPRVYHLACVSQSDRMDWMSTIACLMTSPLQIERPVQAPGRTFQERKAQLQQFQQLQRERQSQQTTNSTVTEPTKNDSNHKRRYSADVSTNFQKSSTNQSQNSQYKFSNSFQRSFLALLGVDKDHQNTQ
ncbi:myb domain-containing protein [Reticulomyxa filosa]|uniref:Myb domain-containing protein n=1 Tax=Reticulomyxa filosa TaxID=46433 RepID=X6MNI9_RETFI|nr:myb domain-containing protein [Reticulomyxa filosa]|eukprot:ETO15389.1 myb domain-containing protein [Reticulomyxa filosa]